MRRASMILCLALVGCGPILVDEGSPQPRIALPPSQTTLALELMPAVPSHIEHSWGENGLRAITVEHWRATLEDGFVRGIGPLYRRPVGLHPAERVLQIGEATPEFTAAAASPMYGVTALAARVRYQARLVDALGREIKRAAGVAAGTRTAMSVDAVGDALDSAVEQMYEQLARELLAPPAS